MASRLSSRIQRKSTTALVLAATVSVTGMTPALAHKVETPRKALLTVETDELECGRKGSIRHLRDSITIELAAQASAPVAEFMATQGDTLRISLKNRKGKDVIISLGSSEEIAHYESLLRHDTATQLISPNILLVAAYSKDQLIWNFSKKGMFEIWAFHREVLGPWRKTLVANITVNEPSSAKTTASIDHNNPRSGS